MSSTMPVSDEASTSQMSATEGFSSSEVSVENGSSSLRMLVTEGFSSSQVQMISLNELFQELKDSELLKIVESITFDAQSQKIILQISKLLKKEASGVSSKHAVQEHPADEKIRTLSQSYKEKYPELMKCFNEWKTCRKELIKVLTSCTKKLKFFSAFVSSSRIFFSVADILGTIYKGGRSEHFIAGLAMEHASTFGLILPYAEIFYSKKIHKDVKNIIKKDQLLFSKISEWFQQTKELDAAIKNFFPYGIDQEIVKRIHSNTTDNLGDCHKMFLSIVASNVKQNVNLFKNKDFIENASVVADSEAGIQWFHRTILENDPCALHTLSSSLTKDIRDLLEISSADSTYAVANKLLSQKVKVKCVMNALTIMACSYRLFSDHKSEACKDLRTLADSLRKELEELEKTVLFLRPSDFTPLSSEL